MAELFRGMRPDPHNPALPAIGNSRSQLGVVKNDDIPVVDEKVQPETGGMSVVCDDPTMLPPHRKPEALGGTAKKHNVFAIQEEQLPADLIARQDRDDFLSHRAVEPKYECFFDAYVETIQSTQASWILKI